MYTYLDVWSYVYKTYVCICYMYKVGAHMYV